MSRYILKQVYAIYDTKTGNFHPEYPYEGVTTTTTDIYKDKAEALAAYYYYNEYYNELKRFYDNKKHIKDSEWEKAFKNEKIEETKTNKNKYNLDSNDGIYLRVKKCYETSYKWNGEVKEYKVFVFDGDNVLKIKKGRGHYYKNIEIGKIYYFILGCYKENYYIKEIYDSEEDYIKNIQDKEEEERRRWMNEEEERKYKYLNDREIEALKKADLINIYSPDD